MKHLLLVTIVACHGAAPSAKAGSELERHAGALIDCRAQGRASADAGAEAGYAAYEACKADAGIK